MARVPLTLLAQDPLTGNAIAGATAQILDRSTGAAIPTAQLFTSEAGGGTEAANPVAIPAAGFKVVWITRRRVEIVWTGGNLAGVHEFKNLVPADDAGVDAAFLDPAAFPPIDALGEGVENTVDAVFTRSSATAVNINAPSGGRRIWVRDANGLLVPTNPAGQNFTGIVATTVAGTFRLDQITVDSTGVIRYRAGTTQAAGITLDNRTGAFVLPAGERLLHDFLVASTGVQVVTSNTTRDRRPWARPGVRVLQRVAGPFTRLSNVAAAIDATNLQRRVEFSQGVLALELRGVVSFNSGATPDTVSFAVQVTSAGAVTTLESVGWQITPSPTNNAANSFTLHWEVLPSDFANGSLLFNPVWNATNNFTATLNNVRFRIDELLPAPVNNGTA